MFEISRSTKWAPTGGYSGSPRHWQSTADASVSACLPYGPLGNKIVERGWQFFGWVWAVFFFFPESMTHHFSFAFMGEIYPYSKGILPRIMEVGPMGSKMIIFPLNHGAMGGTVSTIRTIHRSEKTELWCWKVRESSPKCPKNSGLGICL